MNNDKKHTEEGIGLILFSLILVCIAFAFIFFFPFGHKKNTEESKKVENTKDILPETSEETTAINGLANETAKDGAIDFPSLQKENPDIFAWIDVQGTDIDLPVLQSAQADDFYESHDAYGTENSTGALYTELANLKDMCDFNTVLHGKSLDAGGQFSSLYRFADSDFFQEHNKIYFYLEDNLLTYDVFAAFERETTSLIRTYDFTYASGCQQFLDNIYDTRVMGKNIKEEWKDVTPYNFLITLTTQNPNNQGKEFVVVAVLTGDAAGKIDRVVSE